MQKETLIKSLTNTNLVSLSTATEIADHFKYNSFPKNQFLLTEGKVSDEYFFIEKGYLRAFAHDTDGNEVTTNFCSPGQVAFEVSSFLTALGRKKTYWRLPIAKAGI